MTSMLNYFFTQTPLVFLTASFWRDEAFSYLMAKLPLFQLLSTTAKDANPPLYYVVIKIWMTVFGSTELSLRIVSLLFFWGIVYVVFRICTDAFSLSQRKSTVIALLAIVNPVLHYYAFETRMYTMFAFFALLFTYALFTKRHTLYRISLILGMYTHYFFLFLPLSHVVSLIMTRDKKSFREYASHWSRAFYAYIPWLVMVFFARPPVHQNFWIQPTTIWHFLLLPALLFTGYEAGSGIRYPFLPFMAVLLWALIVFGTWKLFTVYRNHMTGAVRMKITFLYVIALGVPLFLSLVSLIKPIYTPRYFIFCSTALLILFPLITAMMNKKVEIVAIGILFLLSSNYARVQIQERDKAPLRQTMSGIIRMMGPRDWIYVTDVYDYHPALYYARPKMNVKIFNKSYDELPWYVGKVLIPEDAATQTLPLYPARAFILYPNGAYSVQSRR